MEFLAENKPSTPNLKFNRSSNEFYAEVKLRVQHYFQSNKISTHADYRMVLKSIILLSTFVGTYLLFYTDWLSLWQLWIACFILGICTAGIGFSVAHDAIHGAYSANSKINYGIGLTMNLIGGNKYVWSITHNIIHHTYTNIHGYDEDLEVFPAAIRMSTNQERKPIHRIQHFTAFILYGFAVIFWVLFKDFKKISQDSIGPYKVKKHPRNELIVLFISKACYYSYMFVLPLLFLDFTWVQFLIGYLSIFLTSGMILGIVFQMAHVVEDIDYPMPKENGVIDNNWAIHQMHTTANFAMDNEFVSWFVGGLNFQVEHHLFPKVCHIHYPVISKIVQQTAKDFNVPYHFNKTFTDAILSHYRTLKQLGMPVNKTATA